MKTILQTLAAFFLTTMTAPAAVEFNDATLQLLKSTNPSERARFYTVVGKLPPPEPPPGPQRGPRGACPGSGSRDGAIAGQFPARQERPITPPSYPEPRPGEPLAKGKRKGDQRAGDARP